MDIIFPWELDEAELEAARRRNIEADEETGGDDGSRASDGNGPDERGERDEEKESAVDRTELKIVSNRLAAHVEDATAAEVAVGIEAFAVATGKSPFEIYEAVEGSRPSVSPLDFVSVGSDADDTDDTDDIDDTDAS